MISTQGCPRISPPLASLASRTYPPSFASAPSSAPISSSGQPEYFEVSWSILSTISLSNFLLGFLVLGITGWSPISSVPIVVSAAGAIANGLCYYSYYARYSLPGTAIAAGVADVAWLVQEVGMCFYSFQILVAILTQRTRRLFLVGFWTLATLITLLRFGILILRILTITSSSSSSSSAIGTSSSISPSPATHYNYQSTISALHVPYFTLIALLEIWSSIFLLRIFASTREERTTTGGIFRHLARSTEVRLASLSAIGVTRAVTYSFQMTPQTAVGVAGQVDRFAYTMECAFPVVMLIDIMASKLLVVASELEKHPPSSRKGELGYSVSSEAMAQQQPGNRQSFMNLEFRGGEVVVPRAMIGIAR